MNVEIFTVGFAGKTAEQFFALLTEAHVKQLIDIRENRIGQLSGFAKYPDLSFLLERITGIVYSYQPKLAPSVEIRKAYRESKDWLRYETSFHQLMVERGIPQSLEPIEYSDAFALLCSEPGPEKCHRRLVAEILAEHLRSQKHSVQVQHLVMPPRGKSGGKKGRHPDE